MNNRNLVPIKIKSSVLAGMASYHFFAAMVSVSCCKTMGLPSPSFKFFTIFSKCVCEDLARGQSPLLGGSSTRLSVDSGVLIPGLAGSLPW
jgi:hypothetical protein